MAEVEAACAEGVADPSLLSAPLRVVVPSQALRTHLSARLLERTGGPCLGLQIQTHDAAARELLERSGASPADARLAGIAVRAAARREAALARDLDALDDGYAAAVASVDDLLDAGFAVELAEPLAEVLAEQPLGRERDRAEALVRTAVAIAGELEAGTLGHRAALFGRAAARLRADGPAALPTRRLWLHGFADATGVLLDWLEALRSVLEASLWLDLPGDRDWRFGRSLRERLGGTDVASAPAAPEPALRRSAHSDREAEARAAAHWARARLADGPPPERVALVVRELASHRLALRRQLERLGVPFSGVGERGGATPLARRLEACWSLIERGSELPVERWLEARGDLGLGQRCDLRDACAVLGVSRLGELEALEGDALGKGVRLAAPAVLALHEGEPKVRRRRVGAAGVRALRDRARGALRRLAAWPDEAPLAARLEALRELGQALGWSDDGPERRALDEAFPEPERAGPRPISRGDWPRLLRRSLAEAGTDPLGGRGGGVQVLGAMEARGQSFEALRVLGLERGVFPRRISEDPLLPDALRLALRSVLPDLPVKGEGRDEERFLFAQLCDAAPEVHLSRALRDERGRGVSASPFFEALDAPLEEGDPATAAPLDRADTLAASLAAARRDAALPPADCAAAAGARLAAVAELESRRRGLGPYLGVVGPPASAGDPRAATPYVTLLEGAARCPWQAFLRRFLRLAPGSDPHGPLPPAADPRLLGTAVHRAIEQLCDPEADDSPWPEAAPLDRIERAIGGLLRDEGVALRAYEVALARRAAAPVEVARRLQLASDFRVSATEWRGEARLRDADGVERAIRFKADLEERRGSERRLTDWKTGRLDLPVTPAARREKVRQQIAKGALLQGQAYASTGALGRYVYLDPEIDDALREVEVEPEGPQREAFESAVTVLFRALEAGALPPRLRAPDSDEEPGACRSCEVKQACQRGDSGLRARLGGWAEDRVPRGALEAAALDLWWLGVES